MREVIAAPLAGLDLRQRYGHHQSPAIGAAASFSVPGCCRSIRNGRAAPRHAHQRGTCYSRKSELLLESAGSSLDRLVQVHALIYDSIEYDVLNRVYRQYVANGPPARTVWTAQIEAGFKIQLDVVAAA